MPTVVTARNASADPAAFHYQRHRPESYEDLNDHDRLRADGVLALLAGKRDLTGQSRNRDRDRGYPAARGEMENRIKEQQLGLVRRSHQCGDDAGQPVTSLLFLFRLCADARVASPGSRWYGSRARPVLDHSDEVAENRRATPGHRSQGVAILLRGVPLRARSRQHTPKPEASSHLGAARIISIDSNKQPWLETQTGHGRVCANT